MPAKNPVITPVSRLGKLSMLLTLVAATAFIHSPAQARTQTDAEVVAFLRTCLENYVYQTERASSVGPESATAEVEILRIKDRCLTQNFRANWDKIIADTDADPLLRAQDTQASWKTDSRLEALDLDPPTARIILGKGPQEHCLALSLQKTGTGWKISASRGCAE